MSCQGKPVRYKKDPQAPKRFRSAYTFFYAAKHGEIRAKDDRYKTPDVAKMVAEEWKTVSPVDRRVWEEMAQKDKARYEVEKTMYTGPWQIPVSKKRKTRDPSAPKRPMSAFLAFSRAKRQQVKLANPDTTSTDISKLLAVLWRETPEDERSVFQQDELRKREAYKVAMSSWKELQDQKTENSLRVRKQLAMSIALKQVGNQKEFKAALEASRSQDRPYPQVDNEIELVENSNSRTSSGNAIGLQEAESRQQGKDRRKATLGEQKYSDRTNSVVTFYQDEQLMTDALLQNGMLYNAVNVKELTTFPRCTAAANIALSIPQNSQLEASNREALSAFPAQQAPSAGLPIAAPMFAEEQLLRGVQQFPFSFPQQNDLNQQAAMPLSGASTRQAFPVAYIASSQNSSAVNTKSEFLLQPTSTGQRDSVNFATDLVMENTNMQFQAGGGDECTNPKEQLEKILEPRPLPPSWQEQHQKFHCRSSL